MPDFFFLIYFFGFFLLLLSNSYPVVKSGFKMMYASNTFPVLPFNPFLRLVFFFSRRSFRSLTDRDFPPGSLHMWKSQVLSLFPWHSNTFPLSTIGLPQRGHLRPVSFASGRYQVIHPSRAACTAATL